MLGAVWKRWNWLEDGLVPLSAILMHAAWTFPLFSLFMRNMATGERNPGFSFWLCLAILTGGAIAGKMASQNSLGVVIVVVGGLAAIWIALLLTVPADPQSSDSWFAGILDHLGSGRAGEAVPAPFVVGLCSAFLWWRGVRVASAARSETIGSFVTGLVALIGLLFLAMLLPPSPVQAPSRAPDSVLGPIAFLVSLAATLGFAVLSRYVGERAMLLSQMSITVGLLFLALALPIGPSAEILSRWIVIFVTSGLAALALHGVLDTLRQQAEKTGVLVRLDRYWAMAAFGVVFVVLVLGLLVGRIVAPGTVASAFGWLGPIWTALVRALLLLVYAVAYLVFGLFEPLLAGIRNRPPQARPMPFASPLDPEQLERLARDPIQIPPIFGQILQATLILGLVALIAWIFVTAVRKRKRETLVEDKVIETRETILSLDLVRGQLQGLLNSLQRPRTPPLFVETGAIEDPRRMIRDIYQKLLARGIALELPRSRGQTPNAYQQTLGYLCPEEQKALEILTSAYETARYGLVPPSHEQVQAAQAAFARIDATLGRAGGSRQGSGR